MRLKLSVPKGPAGFNPPTQPRALSNQNSYDGFREQADRVRRENRKAEPQIQDGTYGFNEQDTHYNNRRRTGRGNNRGGRRQEQEPGLYSDEMMVDAPTQGSRNKGRSFR